MEQVVPANIATITSLRQQIRELEKEISNLSAEIRQEKRIATNDSPLKIGDKVKLLPSKIFRTSLMGQEGIIGSIFWSEEYNEFEYEVMKPKKDGTTSKFNIYYSGVKFRLSELEAIE